MLTTKQKQKRMNRFSFILPLLRVCIVGVSLKWRIIVGSVVPIEPTNLLNSSSTGSKHLHKSITTMKMQRQLQQPQTFNYRANYTADFQYLMHPSCTGESLRVFISCYGGFMTVLGASDESIKCQQIFNPVIEGGTSYICTNSCNGTSCESVYLVRNGTEHIDGVFGSVQFLCESNSISDIAAVYTLNSSNNQGSCDTDTLARSVRVARMGVSCPIDSSLTREYVYDDTYFECNTNGIVTFNLLSNQSAQSDDIYVCASGSVCNATSCDISFDNIQVDSQLETFASTCVDVLVPISLFPTPAPELSMNINVVRFEASWVASAGTQLQCVNFLTEPTIKLACTNEATTIQFNRSTDDAMRCNHTSNNEMECTGYLTVSKWTTVFFDCFGRNIPSAIVTFPETTAVCDNNINATYLENIVTLAVVCDSVSYSPDRFFECADRRSFFAIEINNGLAGDRFCCIESTTIDSRSTIADTMVIRSVSAMTDANWITDAADICYYQVDSLNTSSPMLVPTPTPSVKPSPTPVMSPVVSPITTEQAPIVRAPTIGMISTQKPSPTLSVSIPPSPSKTNTVVIAAAICGIVGGIIISFFILFVYRKGKSDAKYNDVTDGRYKSNSNQVDLSNRITEENTASRTTSTSSPAVPMPTTASPPVVQMSQVQPAIEIPQSQPVERIVLDPPTSEHYQVHYKDQSRSVVGGIPRQYTPVVTQSSISSKPQLHDVPFATAVPVSIISEMSSSNTNGSNVRSSRVSVRIAAIAESSPPSSNAEDEDPPTAHGPTSYDSNIYEC